MTIEQRMERLEKQVGKYRKLTALLSMFVCVVVTTGAVQDMDPKDVMFRNIKCNQIQILDAEKNERITLDPGDKVKASFVTAKSSCGKWSSSLGEAGLFIGNDKHELFAARADTLKLPGIRLSHKNGLGKIEVLREEMRKDKSPGSFFLPKIPQVVLAATPKGGAIGILQFRPDESKPNDLRAAKSDLMIFLGPSNSGGAISLYNKTNESIVDIKADEYGNGYVGVYDRKGKGRALKPGN